MGFKLSIITVVLNDKTGLASTIDSLRTQSGTFELIVIDGGSTDGTVDVARSNSDLITHFISEPDAGIYDAMNKGIELVSGDGLWFLNAGDIVIGELTKYISAAPALLPVQYVDFLGRVRWSKLRTRKLGIPYCHQGIIFQRGDIRYDLTYQLASDYDYYLKHCFKGVSYVKGAVGYVLYDNEGFSVVRRSVGDRETLTIIRKYFGWRWALLYEIRRFCKCVVFVTIAHLRHLHLLRR